jgi:hypothetical protein
MFRIKAWLETEKVVTNATLIILMALVASLGLMFEYRLTEYHKATVEIATLKELAAQETRHHAEINALRASIAVKESASARRASAYPPIGRALQTPGTTFEAKWENVRKVPASRRAQFARDLANELGRTYGPTPAAEPVKATTAWEKVPQLILAEAGVSTRLSSFERAWDAVRDYTIKQRHEGSGVGGPAVR